MVDLRRLGSRSLPRAGDPPARRSRRCRSAAGSARALPTPAELGPLVRHPEHYLEPWDGRQLELPIEGIWARRSSETYAPWTCEFLLNECSDEGWILSGNETVTKSLAEVGVERNGVPFLRPEIVLLFKSREPTPKNEADFTAVRPHLTQDAAEWLRDAIDAIEPGHPWRLQL